MPGERFYIDAPFSGSVVLEGDEFRHLAKVMRAKKGDTVELINGRGDLALAAVSSIEKQSACLNISSLSHQPLPRPEIILAQALARQNHLEWIIEKGTEIGASAFWLFPGEWSEKKDFKEERLQSLAIAAMKQCGRLYLPQIVKKPQLSSWEPVKGALFFGDLQAEKPLSKPDKEPIIFFVGPEKGFSPREIEILQKRLSATGCKLCQNILRTETAGLAALSQLQLLI